MAQRGRGRLGYVGYLTGMNTGFIESCGARDCWPVAPCLGLARTTNSTISTPITWRRMRGISERRSIDLLTDVAGVLNGEQVLSEISAEMSGWCSAA